MIEEPFDRGVVAGIDSISELGLGSVAEKGRESARRRIVRGAGKQLKLRAACAVNSILDSQLR